MSIDRSFISWDASGGRVRSFTTTGRAGTSILKIELEFTDGYELADVLRQLQDAQRCQPAARPRKAIK